MVWRGMVLRSIEKDPVAIMGLMALIINYCIGWHGVAWLDMVSGKVQHSIVSPSTVPSSIPVCPDLKSLSIGAWPRLR